VVPFDAERSLLVRFVEDLPATAAIPFPNLRSLTADELALVKQWIEDGARHDGHAPFSDTAHLLFACNQGDNTVSVFDAQTLRLVRIVDFADHGIPSAPYGPHHITFEPDGSAWYVSIVSAGVVARMSMDLSVDPSDAAFLLGRTRPGVFVTPGMLALDAETPRLFVGRSTLSDPLASGFAILDRRTMDLEVIATPFNVPHAMTVTPDGRFALTAELTGSQQESRIAVYDSETGDLALVALPATDGPRELIHFSILGAHHMMGMTAASPGAMDHGDGHGGMDHSGGGYPYTATLTSRSTDEVLFFSLAEDGTLTLTASAPGGDGPFHAHTTHDGSAVLVPNQRGSTVTIVDAATRAITRTVADSAPAGPISQPHSPAPSLDGTRFFVTSSNLNGAWTPTYAFLGPPAADGTRQPLPASAFGNLAVYTMEGALQQVIQLGTYPSGLEPFSRAAHEMDHGTEHDAGHGSDAGTGGSHSGH
jgi:DNA-binding beta-propeller fold protein YncE